MREFLTKFSKKGGKIGLKAYNTYGDHELVLLLKDDDQEAMRAIYDRYWDKLLAVAVNRLGIEQEAEECVQDVFLSLWKRREGLVLKHELSTYLWVAVKYQVINRLDKRYAKRNLKTTELKDEFSIPSPEAHLLEKELLKKISATVDSLPEKCKMIYRMSREEGKSNKEIAAELKLSEKTVEGHVTRALKDIRTNLSSVVPAFMICSILQDMHDKF